MKKNLICAAIASSMSMLAGFAQAQSNVSMYGLIDANIAYSSDANAAKDGQLKLNSGGMNTSRFGFRGSEDLGDGLKAIIQLEGGILLDTGALDGDLFGRQANVGLQGNFGKIIGGRSYSTTYDFMQPFDPMGYAPQFSWVTSGNVTGARKDGMLTTVSNVVKYQYEGQGYKLGATYGLGEVAGDNTSNSKLALAASANFGALSTVLSYEQINGTALASGAIDKTTAIHLAGTYQIGDAKLFAGVRDYKKSLATGAKELQSDMFWTGVSYQLTPVWNLTGAYYYQDLKNLAAGADADPGMLVGRAKYALSKRTDIYIAAAYAKGTNGKLVGVSRDDVAFGTSQNSATVGIQHRF